MSTLNTSVNRTRTFCPPGIITWIISSKYSLAFSWICFAMYCYMFCIFFGILVKEYLDIRYNPKPFGATSLSLLKLYKKACIETANTKEKYDENSLKRNNYQSNRSF